MDTLHTVLRSIRGETKARRDHIDVFREFLDQLDRAARREQPPRNTKAAMAKPSAGNADLSIVMAGLDPATNGALRRAGALRVPLGQAGG